MWYGLIGDAVYIETKAKSQKAANLRRDPRMVFMVEARDQLRLAARRPRSMAQPTTIEAAADEEYWAAARSVYERYTGPYTDGGPPAAWDLMMAKRIVVKLVPQRVRSWDHRKLGLDSDRHDRLERGQHRRGVARAQIGGGRYRSVGSAMAACADGCGSCRGQISCTVTGGASRTARKPCLRAGTGHGALRGDPSRGRRRSAASQSSMSGV